MPNGEPKSIESLASQGYEVKIGEYLSGSWDIFKQNGGGFIGFIFVVFAINVVLAFIPILGGIASMVINAPLTAGAVIVALRIAKRRPISFNDFFLGFNMFLPLFLAGLLTGVLTGIGFLLLIIPGIYLAVAYAFTVPLIVERKLDFWEAMEGSRKLITKQWFSMFVFILVLALINFVGVLILGVGVLVTAPWTLCCSVAAYQDIVGFLPSSDDAPVDSI